MGTLDHHWTFIAKAYRNWDTLGWIGNEEDIVSAKKLNGWAVYDAGDTGNENNPGIYISFMFNDKHLITVSFTENDLVEMLTEVQALKRGNKPPIRITT